MICKVCGRPVRLYGRKSIKHHTDYFPERVITVHARCHAKIHLRKQRPDLQPPKGHYKLFKLLRQIPG